MKSPRVVTVYFDPGPHGRYDMERLLNVYAKSADVLQVPLEVVKVPTPPADPNPNNPRWMIEVEHKVKAWKKIVDETEVPVIITDADMLMCRDPRPIFKMGTWDIGVTTRGIVRPPINTGVLFARPTEGARRFMALWRHKTEILQHSKDYKRWESLFASTDQAAVGEMLMYPDPNVAIARFPCTIWNCADTEWEYFHDTTAFLHVKGDLRRHILGEPLKNKPTTARKQAIERVSRIWKGFER